MKNGGARNCAQLGLLLALALICSYVETLIPFSFGIPGIKLGLSNLVIVTALYLLGLREAAILSVARILLAGMLFGNPFSIVYSLAGGILSLAIMALLKRWAGLHILTISATGGIFHNLGQLIVAALVVENLNLFYYMFVLFFSGCVTGLLIGFVSQQILAHLRAVPKDAYRNDIDKEG